MAATPRSSNAFYITVCLFFSLCMPNILRTTIQTTAHHVTDETKARIRVREQTRWQDCTAPWDFNTRSAL